MELFKAIFIAKKPEDFSPTIVESALAALQDYITKRPETAHHYQGHVNALGKNLADRVAASMAEAVDPLGEVFNLVEKVVAGSAPAPLKPKPSVQAAPAFAKFERLVRDMQDEPIPMPIWLALFVADNAGTYDGATLADAMLALKGAEPETREQANRKKHALYYLGKALADWQSQNRPAC